MTKQYSNSELFTIADSSIYELFSSKLYDGFGYCEKSDTKKFTTRENLQTLLGHQPTEKYDLDEIIYFEDLHILDSILSTFHDYAEIAHIHDLRIMHQSGEIIKMQCHFYSKPNLENDVQVIFIGFKNKELEVKEQLFRQIFFDSPSGMALVNLDAKICQPSKKLCDFLGYSEVELLQTQLRNLSYPADKYLTQDIINQLLAGSDETLKVDKRYIHKNGSVIWAQVSMTAIKNEFGEILHFVVQLQDIDERKKTEFLLTNYKDLLERSNKVAKIGTWEIDVIEHTVSWSKSLASIINTRENFVPKFYDSVNHLIRMQHREIINLAIKNSLEAGVNFDVQLLANTADDSVKWIRMIGIAERENGKTQRLYGLIQDISDIKIAQQELANKEELWRTTFNHANAGIALINFYGEAYNVNQSFCDIFGYTIDEMQHIRIKDVSIAEDLEGNIELMENLISGTINNFTTQRQFRTKDKAIIWTNVTVSAVKNDYNQFTHMVAQIIDITESKTNEILLEKYRKILERSNHVAKIGSWEFDVASRRMFCSKNLLHLLGAVNYGRNFVTESVTNYLLEEDQKYALNLLNNAIRSGSNFDVELQLKTSTGLRWMRLIGISDYEHGTCKLLHGLVQDIQEVKSAQLEVLLREQEFRQTFWHAPIGMALIDLTGKVVRANPNLCEMFGYTEKEILEIDKSFISPAEDAEITDNLIQQLLDGKSDSFQLEKRYIHKNQNLIWGILSMSAVKNNKGETTHFVTSISDITEKKLLTERLKEHNNRLQNYAHIVSHNLRSHTGNLSMLLELSEISEKQSIDQELFDHIKSASRNLSQTVAHLSEIVEIQNIIKNTLVPQNVLNRINNALENVQSTLNQISFGICIDVNKDLTVRAIPSYLDSIILNILTNAIKYRSADRTLKITILAKKTKAYTTLSFEDNGLGIDLNRYGSKIFGMYKTFHNHQNALGIGLFMTKNQIEAMGGSIDVISKEDVGSKFTIYFKDEDN